MCNHLRILIVTNDQEMRKTLRDFLEPKGLDVEIAADGVEALKKFEQSVFDVVLTELAMPRMGGAELLNRLRERVPEIYVVLLDVKGSRGSDGQEKDYSAFDYTIAPLDQKGLFSVIERVAEQKSLLARNMYPHHDRRKTYRFENIIGKTTQMLGVFRKIRDVAGADILVVVTGESGTGKELVANAIHYTGRRKGGPYIKLNCASLPEGLIESELFGHEKGAFTTAVVQKKGRFELAHGGTLFLDEIAEMPLPMQAKLLRVLDDGNFERVGGTKTLHSDARIICATNKDIQQEVKEKRIREDLYYRIKAASIQLPPLRERRDDIPLLANFFAYLYSKKNRKSVVGFSQKSHATLMAYGWPGNVRELSRVVEQAVVFCKGREIGPQCLPEDIKQRSRQSEFTLRLSTHSLPVVESTLIRKVLEESNWNVKQAAKELEIARGTLYSKMKKYNIERPY